MLARDKGGGGSQKPDFETVTTRSQGNEHGESEHGGLRLYLYDSEQRRYAYIAGTTHVPVGPAENSEILR